MAKAHRLSDGEIAEMVDFVALVFSGAQKPEDFFARWVDIASDEDPNVRELWFSMSYYENDIDQIPDCAEYYKNEALRYAINLRNRNKALS